MKVNIDYPVYGTFEVTTEGDCEGRTTRHLGTYTGYIDEIAFALADKCFYSLEFKLIDPKEIDMSPKKNKVSIHLSIDSGTWDLSVRNRIEYFKNLFKDRENVVVDEKCNNYASVNIYRNISEEELKTRRALDKLERSNLTDEDLELLIKLRKKKED